MGIWDRMMGQAGAQFLDVIQWLDDSNDTLVYRFPIHDQAITDQSKLIVREGQAALFVSEGKLSEVFGPGTYTLDTANQPITSFFRTIAYSFNNPYKGDVLFVSTRRFNDNGWGTQAPFLMRDPDFGQVNVRAFGTFSFKVSAAVDFVKEIVGTDGHFTTDEIVGQLKRRVVSQFISAVAKKGVGIADLAATYHDLGDEIRGLMNPEFETNYGLTLTDFSIANIGLPDAVREAIDKAGAVRALGGTQGYTQLKAADAIETAAGNEGMGGLGASLGVGMGLGGAVGQAVGGAMGGGQTPPPAPNAVFHHSGPHGQSQGSAQQIAQAIAADPSADHQIWQAGFPGWTPWSEVPAIAQLVPPPSAGPPPPPGSTPPPLPAATPFHYSGPDGQAEGLSAQAVAQKVTADPGAEHHVWQKGFDGWKPAADVAEIAAALDADSSDDGPPPPPPA